MANPTSDVKNQLRVESKVKNVATPSLSLDNLVMSRPLESAAKLSPAEIQYANWQEQVSKFKEMNPFKSFKTLES